MKDNVNSNSFKVIYIMGTARSGTTLLEIMLSEAESIYGFGELTHSLKDGLIEHKACSCDQDVWNCHVWKSVLNEYLYEDHEKVVDANNLIRTHEHHLYFFNNLLNFYKNTVNSYNSINKQLFDNAKEVTGKPVLLDSSKYPGRALSLNKYLSDKIFIVCMTRSPEGLIKAFQKKDAGEQQPKNLFHIFLYYTYVLLCCRIVLWKYPQQSICITYEELCNYPEKTLQKIQRLSQVSLEIPISKISEQEEFQIHHILTGNRLRYNKSIKFEPQLKTPTCDKLNEKITCFFMRLFKKTMRF